MLIMELAERAYYRGQKDQEFRRPMTPGQFFMDLPQDQKDALKKLTSDDLKNIRFDAISHMLHPVLFSYRLNIYVPPKPARTIDDEWDVP